MQGYIKTVSGHLIKLKQQKPGPKPLPPEAKKRRVNISISPNWHERGKVLAKAAGLSFSQYVEDLVVYHDSLCNES